MMNKGNVLWNKTSWWLLKVALTFIIHYSSFIITIAQPGTWQSHFSYQSGQSVAVVGNKVYAAAQNGFFYFDKTTSETSTLDKQRGLSDVGISRLLYLADQNRLLIAYQSGNIDLLTLSATGEPGAVQNINTIVSAPNLPASRTINHINRVGNTAYLSTNFGLVALDLVRNEIRDTYFPRRIDQPNEPLPILQTAATTDSLYALTVPTRIGGTTNGFQAIRLSPSVNIADPVNWQTVATSPITNILVVQNRFFAAIFRQGVFEQQGNRWVLTQPVSDPITYLFPAGTSVGFATNQAITVPGSGTFTGPLLIEPREVVADGNRIWVADVQSGLLAGNAGTFEQIAPEGPSRDTFYARLYDYPQTLIALLSSPIDSPAPSQRFIAADRLSVPDQRWQRLTLPIYRSFSSAAYLPAEQRLFLGSFNGGLWSLTNEQPLTTVTLPASIGSAITNLATDVLGNLWIGTAGDNNQPTTLHVRRPDGTFQSFPIITQRNIADIVPDDNGFLWLRLDGGGGLLVVDPQTNRSRFLSTQRGSGGLLSNTVRALVKDRNGTIWVGTDLGPTVFDNPAGAFDPVIDAQPPILNRRRLLANEVVTAIAVDGGNRKWIGTRSGLYRVSTDGSQLLDTFTADNSPLPGNLIQNIAIEPVSGRVFIQTEKGIVSYGGIATEPAEALTGLTIFPNPVRPDFTGTVGVNGLTDNATVKILDAGGQLVYETRSQGGTATWNLRDYRGRAAQTGIYLVIVVAADGSQGLAGKLAVVR